MRVLLPRSEFEGAALPFSRCQEEAGSRPFGLGEADRNEDLLMGYRILQERDAKYQPRKGLEGPFFYPGKVIYYDPREGKYWDPDTDFYIPTEEVESIKQRIFDIIRR